MARHIVVETQHRAERAAADMHRVERERVALAAEQTELSQRLVQLAAERNGITARVDEQTLVLAEHNELIDDAQKRHDDALQQAAAAQERLTAGKVALGQAGEKLLSRQREKRHLELALDETRRQHGISSEQVRNPTAKFSYHLEGRPSSNGIRTILYPVGDDAFHEPWNATKASPKYLPGNWSAS